MSSASVAPPELIEVEGDGELTDGAIEALAALLLSIPNEQEEPTPP